ncbi:MAG: methyl-accepting chemotaxis protein [Pontibacterium sp.]
MKINMPVTDREVKLRDGQQLVTKTDLKGTITYANSAFIEISGFSEAELVGQNHNVVRHPDMPPAAFKDLWDTLKLGRPWNKLVKNRCKSGDYYWVKANVTPIFKNGEVVEYMSVRTAPTEAEISAAPELYKKLSNKEAAIPDPAALKTRTLMRQIYTAAGVAVGIGAISTAGAIAADVHDGFFMIGPTLGFLVLLGTAIKVIKSNVVQPMDQVIRDMKTISEGEYLCEMNIDQPGEVGIVRRALKSLAIRMGYEVNDARERAMSALRIQEALDNVSSSVMLADNNGDIIYMNASVQAMMKDAEDDIRQDLPNFDASKLVGANFDSFHKNPAHQRNMIAALTKTFNGQIKVGPRSFDLTANPVVAEDGTRLGTVVEWADVTDQLKAEEEVQALIQAAARGELNSRLDAEAYAGFMKNVAGGVNSLLDTVVEPLMDVKNLLSDLSEGDLTQRMDSKYQGEFAELSNALNATLDKLSSMVFDISSAGGSITVGASEIAHGNATLSNRTEAQAASLEETAASMEEMTGTVKQNAENARHARDLAAEAKTMATQGNVVSQKVVSSMKEISTSSSRIVEIIGVIDEIAFQTNLLALNAAVEAARAGEQGRGFAVVASEVRSLAQRSASAAKEIKELINDSVSKVDEGAVYVDESGAALNSIMGAVDKVSDIISEIASASEEQATGISQVNTAVSQMDEGTQQNAALVQEVAAASETMEEQAQQLQRLVAFFRLEEGAAPATASAAPAPARATRAPVASAKPAAPVKSPVKATSSAVSDEWEEF